MPRTMSDAQPFIEMYFLPGLGPAAPALPQPTAASGAGVGAAAAATSHDAQ